MSPYIAALYVQIHALHEIEPQHDVNMTYELCRVAWRRAQVLPALLL